MTIELHDADVRPQRPQRPLRNALLIALVAFVVAIALTTWAFTRWDPARRLIVPEPIARPVDAVAAPVALSAPPIGTTPTDGQFGTSADVAVAESRVAGLEARLAQIDARAGVAAVNAARAEGLLIAFAARRAIDRGAPLGYIEGQLRTRFADAQPRAVAAVIAGAQAPVTLDRLRERFDAIAPQLAGLGPRDDWSGAVRRTVRSLFVVRRADTPSPVPDERLARASFALDTGQVEVALTEVARLPGSAAAAEWMASARRYIEAHRALDILEAAALTATTTPTPGPVK